MRSRILVAALVAAFTATLSFADDPKPQTGPGQAEMEAMMKAATPGDAHKKLGAMAGTFNADVKMWMQPGAPPAGGGGLSENTWALDGRWLEQHFTGNFMGMPFSGVGFTGYDNIKKKYVGTWMDTMTTSVMISSGTANADGKSYTFTSSMDDPMTGKSTPVKETITVIDNDHHTLEMWGPAPDGKMFKTMEIAYTRKK
ncbi:MAG TPA: DUF1579 domain-containing protein [Thermoanaerobaculia bacterium]|jgi:hypothetical protein|nr:DUF1579 domain-containing protein [Thermoanaerobaculia bacterium]